MDNIKKVKPKKDQNALIPADTLQAYFADLKRFPALTQEEETELAKHYREFGDRESAYKLVVSNLRLVVKIAMDFHRQWMVSLTDLIQEGNIGLMEAVKKFDPYMGVKLSSYASFWIKAYIIKFIMDNFRLVKVGTTQAQRKLFFNLKKEKHRLDQLGFDPEPKLLAENLQVTEKEVVEMSQRLDGGDLSLDIELDEDSNITHKDLLPAGGQDLSDQVANKEIRAIFNRKLREFRSKLSKRDRYILDERILSNEPKTLQEVGELFKISRERARQIETKIIRNLKEFIQKEIPDLTGLEIGSMD